MEFEILREDLLAGTEVNDLISDLVIRKRRSNELSLEPMIQPLNDFIDKSIEYLEGTASYYNPALKADSAELDKILFEIVSDR
jgi:predicted nucleotidyltransferase